MTDVLSTSAAPTANSSSTQRPARQPLSRGARQRRLREALLAYAFLLPAFLIVGLFGLFPLIFAAYQSTLRGINKVVGTFDGLGNYVRAVDVFTYVLGFWGAVVLVWLALRGIARSRRAAAEADEPFVLWSLPGILFGALLLLALGWIITLLPLLLAIPDQMRGPLNTPENFRRLLLEALTNPAALQWMFGMLLALVLGILTAVLVQRSVDRRNQRGNYMTPFVAGTAMLGLAGLLLVMTWNELQTQIADATVANAGLDLGSQIVLISAGFGLLALSWWLWSSASHRDSMVSTVLRLGGAVALVVAAWMLIAELPRAIGAGDPVWWYGLLATFYYAMGTIPPQLIVALMLAALLFQEIRGRTFFRMVYFLPYIAPFVGTAAVFKIIFSSRPDAPVNAILGLFGLPAQLWLNDPRGIFNLLLPAADLPQWAAGPSLALVVIMIFGVWTFFGFNTVVFLAGLGNIPRELYEAAAIDGAGRWPQFRHITLPLLSPTIYFLVLYSVIGTFKAFNHIYVLRTGAALGTTDTASVVIFQTFKRDTRIGYASALAILLLLVIIILTVVNNRVASKRVHYG